MTISKSVPSLALVSTLAIQLCWSCGLNGQMATEASGGTSSILAGSGGQAPIDAGSESAAGGAPAARLVAKSIDAGYFYSCTVLSDGSIRCWGKNEHGQLGDGSTIDSPVPVTVTGITRASAVSVDAYHVCALLTGGSVECWGYKSDLGSSCGGTATQSHVPVAIAGIASAIGVAAGDCHSCAVLASGTVQCWGDNQFGSIGNGTLTSTAAGAPVSVVGISDATSIAAAYFQTCAALRSGKIVCWGSNGLGQLGDGTKVNSAWPVAVSGLSSATAVTVGSQHACALLKDGSIRCWGDNRCGQLGDGTSTSSTVPVTVSGISDAIAVDAGVSQTCALLSDGTVWCWGVKQLCVMSNEIVSRPVAVPGIADAIAIAAGYQHNCALLANDAVQCWGFNYSGALGDGTTTNSPEPVAVIGF